jgi:acetylornithine aminotransferase
VSLDPDSQVIPTLGSKEAIFHLAQVVGGELVAIPSPAYPVYERGALFAGKQIVEFPLRDGVPDFTGVPWDRVGLLWLNYPNNPTAAVAGIGLYEEAAALAREHDFLFASDEAYSELYFGPEPPASALQVQDLTNVLALNTLSKRSAMPGFRSGFAAGDASAVTALKRYRPNVGVAPQEFVQRAATLAWGDEAHVEAMRNVYRAKREVLLPVLEAAGFRNAGGDATMFLWLEDPHDRAADLLEQGVILAPGGFFGAAGEGYARLALVPELEACERAAEIIARMGAA